MNNCKYITSVNGCVNENRDSDLCPFDLDYTCEYFEHEDGPFVRTSEEPEGTLEEYIKGIDSYVTLAQSIGELVESKQKAYGNSFGDSDTFLKLLFPNGVPVEKYTDLLTLARIFDKMKRIATQKDAFGESPYRDITGYGLLGTMNDMKEGKNIDN